MAKHESILGTVGNTPVVKINRLAPAGVNLYVKIEAFNPLGSVKDRLALEHRRGEAQRHDREYREDGGARERHERRECEHSAQVPEEQRHDRGPSPLRHPAHAEAAVA